jgi:hypothetical protein
MPCTTVQLQRLAGVGEVVADDDTQRDGDQNLDVEDAVPGMRCFGHGNGLGRFFPPLL